MEDSILLTIKKLLGLCEDYNAFDMDIIIHINMVFNILNQMGVGPKEGFIIKGPEDKWNDYVRDSRKLEMVKTYIYLKYRCVDKDYNSKETKITRMEIANNIGLSVKSDNNLKTVMNIVKSLENNKLIKTSKRYVTEVSPNGNEVVKCYKFFKVNDYDEWVLENKK